MPPVTTAAPRAATSWSISACASGANSPTVICSSRERIPTSLVPSEGWFVRIGKPRYTCRASTDTTSVPSRAAVASATALLPEAVGPNTANTSHPVVGALAHVRVGRVLAGHVLRGGRSGHRPPPHASSLTAKCRRMSAAFVPGSCRSLHTEARAVRPRPGTASRPRSVVDVARSISDGDELPRLGLAREVDRGVPPGAATEQRRVSPALSLDEHLLDAPDARARSDPMRRAAPPRRDAPCAHVSGPPAPDRPSRPPRYPRAASTRT